MRLAILFVAPPEKDFSWDEEAVQGCNRFLKRAWRIVWQLVEGKDVKAAGPVVPDSLDKDASELNRELNRLGIKCTQDFDRGQFNTAISAVMELVNAASKYVNALPADKRDAALCTATASAVVRMLAPIVPHWSEELWHEALGGTESVYNVAWPEFDESQAVADTISIAVQVKGKLRGHAMVAADASKEDMEAAAKEAVASYLEGKTIKKVVVVPGKLVNIVAI